MSNMIEKDNLEASMLSILVVAGVRPQYVKVAAMKWALERYNYSAPVKINAIYLDTGQHYDKSLANDIIKDLGIDFDFKLSHKDLNPIQMFGSMFGGTYDLLVSLKGKVSLVVVNGDATSAFAGALAAVRAGVPVVHIEAGMRSGNLREAEEANRRMIDHISSLHFCTSKVALKNLNREGIVDTVLWVGDLTHEYIVDFANSLPTGLGPFKAGGYILASLHKPLNIDSDQTLESVIKTLSEYDRKTLFVLHPRTRKRLEELNLLEVPNIKFIDALPYSKMLSAMKGSAYILTDSGGTHREAYYLKKRCLVRRDSGGWLGLINSGIHHRIGTTREQVLSGLDWAEQAIKQDPYEYLADDDLINPQAIQLAFDTLVNFASVK